MWQVWKKTKDGKELVAVYAGNAAGKKAAEDHADRLKKAGVDAWYVKE